MVLPTVWKWKNTSNPNYTGCDSFPSLLGCMPPGAGSTLYRDWMHMQEATSLSLLRMPIPIHLLWYDYPSFFSAFYYLTYKLHCILFTDASPPSSSFLLSVPPPPAPSAPPGASMPFDDTISLSFARNEVEPTLVRTQWFDMYLICRGYDGWA